MCALGMVGLAAVIGCGLPTAAEPSRAPASADVQASPGPIAPTTRPAPTAVSPTTQPPSSPKQSPHIVTILPPVAPLEELRSKPLYEFNEREVDVYLKHLRQTEPDLRKRIMHLARKNLGQPYQIFLLGEHPFEVYDPDPMYCLSRSDCVTFSEHTYAMALAHDWPSFFMLLQRLRYQDGRVGTLTRNHETLCEWDRHNAWLFEDLTSRLGGGNASVPLRGQWKPAKFFAQFGIGQDRPDVEIIDAYIPRAGIAAIEPELMDGDFINVIRGDDKLQFAGHVGIIGHGEDGTVHLIHSARPQVREEPLQGYLTRNEGVLGMKFLRLRPDAEAAAARELARGLAGGGGTAEGARPRDR